MEILLTKKEASFQYGIKLNEIKDAVHSGILRTIKITDGVNEREFINEKDVEYYWKSKYGKN